MTSLREIELRPGEEAAEGAGSGKRMKKEGRIKGRGRGHV
jgi:hypothetical protein